VFHLAAQSFVPMSWQAPSETFTTNVIGQINLFEALRETPRKGGESAMDLRIILAGAKLRQNRQLNQMCRPEGR